MKAYEIIDCLQVAETEEDIRTIEFYINRLQAPYKDFLKEMAQEKRWKISLQYSKN